MKPAPLSGDDIEAQAAEMLRRIGWEASDMKQIEVYARMSPAQKVEQMFRLRRQHVRLLETRLQREHPESTPLQIKLLVLEHLALLHED